MTTIAILQARMGSTRLPGKVLRPLAGVRVLDRVSAAARRVPGVDRLVVATSTGEADDAIAAWGAETGISVFRGDEQDVLGRFAAACADAGLADDDVVLRLTADCPLIDPQVCGMVLRLMRDPAVMLASNVDPATWPDGLDCEAFRVGALRAAAAEATRPSDREHVGPFIRRNRHRFPARNLRCPVPGLGDERWTLDTPEDAAFLDAVLGRLADRFGFLDVLAVLDAAPDLRGLNAGTRNSGFAKSLAGEDMPSAGFATTERLYKRAGKVIPLGSQTFSKSHIQYPRGHAPLFATHGQGGRIYDVDGNEYIDLVSGLLPVVLGYRDPDVDAAVAAQLDSGISFSLSTDLEAALAERLVEIVPAAEMVRYGKNGSDATTAAIRLARAFTGRDRVITCGYHGWHDWYIGSTTRSKGVPPAVRGLTSTVPYNDLDAVRAAFEQHPGEIACLIMEPMNAVDPKPGYLEELAELVRSRGALLVFDEIITGFRYHLGGAQALLGVTPDLACFGKAMANGMPLSAVVGRADVMMEMEEIFFSGTFGGEALSLAAAIATVDKMRREPVIETLWQRGAALSDGLGALLRQHGLDDIITLHGRAPWRILAVADHPQARKEAIKTRLLIDMLERGVLIAASHNVTYAHTEQDVSTVLAVYDRALGRLREALDGGRLEAELPCPPLEPVFKVR